MPMAFAPRVFSPTATLLASVASDDTMRLWSVDDVDQLLHARRDRRSRLDGSRRRPIGKDRRSDDQGRVQSGRSRIGRLRRLPRACRDRSDAWSPRGSRIASGDREGRVTVHAWPDDANQRRRWPSIRRSGTCAGWSDGATLVTAGGFGGAIVATRVGGRPRTTIDTHTPRPWRPADSPDQRRLSVMRSEGSDGGTRRPHRCRHRCAIRGSAVTDRVQHDGHRLWSRATTRRLVFRVDGADEPIRLSVGSQLDGAGFGPTTRDRRRQ